MPNRQQQLRDLLALHLRAILLGLWAIRRRRRPGPQPIQPGAPLPGPPPHPGGQHARRRRRRGPNIPRERINTMGMSTAYILRTYRLDMGTILTILREIEPHLEPGIVIQTAVPPLHKLLAVLHFCATGSFQHTVGMTHGISQPMFCRILSQVLAAMLRNVDRHIYMPPDQAAIIRQKAQFNAIANMPHTVGCIDCTHVALVPPMLHEAAFRNRKMQHTINVQMVCDSDLCFQHVCARYPGSCHDAAILRSSSLYGYMDRRAAQRMWLLGEYRCPSRLSQCM